jgi:hypothetical protein
MKKVMLNIVDDLKAEIVIQFLQEMRCLYIEDQEPDFRKVKKLHKIPQSILHPRTSKTFRMFCKEELHER